MYVTYTLFIMSAPKNNHPPCQLTQWNQYTLMHVHPILFSMWVYHKFNTMPKGTSGQYSGKMCSYMHLFPHTPITNFAMCIFTLMHSHMHHIFVAVRSFSAAIRQWYAFSHAKIANIWYVLLCMHSHMPIFVVVTTFLSAIIQWYSFLHAQIGKTWGVHHRPRYGWY
jgi:hypothetical protein